MWREIVGGLVDVFFGFVLAAFATIVLANLGIAFGVLDRIPDNAFAVVILATFVLGVWLSNRLFGFYER